MRSTARHILSMGVLMAAWSASALGQSSSVPRPTRQETDALRAHQEVPEGPPATREEIDRTTSPDRATGPWVRGRFTSVQVNVNALGQNIRNDAANEPSIAIDPTDPSRIVIGWRQFDTITNNFRKAGWAYSHDAGLTWTFPGTLETIFRSDPILDADADGNIYYYSLRVPNNNFLCDVFRSTDGGVTWEPPVFAFGGDKAWFTIDRTSGPGRGSIYAAWSLFAGCCGNNTFNRSLDGGQSFTQPISIPEIPRWGTLSVGPNGELYIIGVSPSARFTLLRSTNASNPSAPPTFDRTPLSPLPGNLRFSIGPNPSGLLGQAWVATDHSNGPSRGNVYVLASSRVSAQDPLDVLFARSTNGGSTFSLSVRVNDDPFGNGAWQWFGTMSVAPNGRIDAIWNDTRNSGGNIRLSELFYSFSTDEGRTWAPNIPVSPQFDSHLGWPRQNKIGDYYDMISDDVGVSIAYSATFNGEQDVYFLRIGFDCNNNGISDADELASGAAQDCNGNGILDQCELDQGIADDCNANEVLDECELDTDGDGVIDDCDNCLLVANGDQSDADSDGKGNVCDPCPNSFFDDRDGDGVCDINDECPNDPNKTISGVCGCGVVDNDSDADGVADCNDLCAGVDDNVFAPQCVSQIPAVSTWGLIVLTLLLLVGAKAQSLASSLSSDGQG